MSFLSALFKRNALPEARSEVSGLAISVTRQEGDAAQFLTRPEHPFAPGYYEVTVRATGENPAYPANDNVLTRYFTHMAQKDAPGYGSPVITALRAEDGKYAAFVVEEKNGTVFLTARLAGGKADRNGRLTSTGQNIPEEKLRPTP